MLQAASALGVGSPYQFNPLDLNPVRDLLAHEIDFDAIQTDAPVRLLLSATRVSDGALRIFREQDVTLDVVLASSCVPQLHHAVSINGEPHWDGGFAANPPLIRIPGEGLGVDSCAVAKRVGWCAMSRGGRLWRGLLVI